MNGLGKIVCDFAKVLSLEERVVQKLVYLCLSLGLAGPVAAERYMMIYQDGDPGKRCAFYADIDSPTDRGDARSLKVVEIYESADGPYASLFDGEYRISDGQCRLIKGTDFYRDDSRTKEYSHGVWQRVPNNWQRRAFDFATRQEGWRKALISDTEHEKLTRQVGAQPALAAEGCLFVGQHFYPESLDRLTWTAFWKDGARPAFAFSQPPAQRAKEKAELAAYLDEVSLKLGAAVRMGEGMKTQAERQALIDKIKGETANSRPYSPFNQTLRGWLGQSEQTLLAQEGTPTRVRVDQGVRILTYRSSRSQDILMVTRSSVAKVGQDDSYMDVTYFVVDGVIVDFALSGTDPGL